MNYAQMWRMHFIDAMLQADGRVTRAQLMMFFSISSAQASRTFARYLELFPNNMKHNTSEREYQRTDAYQYQPMAYVPTTVALQDRSDASA